jgi:hypothetical protein
MPAGQSPESQILKPVIDETGLLDYPKHLEIIVLSDKRNFLERFCDA